jgi:hypothetical protein
VTAYGRHETRKMQGSNSSVKRATAGLLTKQSLIFAVCIDAPFKRSFHSSSTLTHSVILTSPSITSTSATSASVYQRNPFKLHLEASEMSKIAWYDIGTLQRKGESVNAHRVKFRLSQMGTGAANMQNRAMGSVFFSFHFGVHHSTLKHCE